jgi:putative ABC transport system permease protein
MSRAGAGAARPHRRRSFGFNLDLERDLDEELAAHLDHAVCELTAQGLAEDAAREEAARRFGDAERHRLTCREVDRRGQRARRRGEMMNDLLQDARYTVRTLRRSPAFVAGVLLAMAMAIGANTAIFTVANALLLQPLPFREGDRLMQVQRTFPGGGMAMVPLPYFLYWRDHDRSFERLAAANTLASGFNLAGAGSPPDRVFGSRVSQEYFAVFAVSPALGRDFLPEEGRPGARRVVILSQGLWSRRFGSDPGVLGRGVRLNGELYTVVGVMPRSFRFPAQVDLWTPLQIDPATRDKADILEVTGRLAHGVSREQAETELQAVGRQLAAAEPDVIDNPKQSLRVVPLRERLYGSLAPQLWVLLGAGACVLLVACVNVGNLQLARSAGRARELAIRSALGAGARRLVALLLTECVLLALAGGAAGLVLATWAMKPLLALSPVEIQPLTPIHVDCTVLGFALGISLLSGLLFGLLPALQVARPLGAGALQEGTSRSIGSRHGTRLRRALVVTEVALALAPLVLAIQLVKSFASLLHTDPGFTADHLLTLKLSMPATRYGDPETFQRFAQQVRERASSIPGVRAIAFTTTVPMEPGPAMPFAIEGKYQGKGSDVGVGRAEYRGVDDSFFAALGIPVLRGRAFDERDRRRGELVAMINEAAARRYWPRQNPIGQRITIGKPAIPELGDPVPRTIVGVVRNVRELGPQWTPPEMIYVPLAQVPKSFQSLFLAVWPMSLVVRTAGEPLPSTAALEHAIWAVDPEQPVTDVADMEVVVSRAVSSERYATLLLGLLAAAVLALAASGIYGVLSYLVGQRTREIGVRMTLGATRRRVLWLFVRQGAGPVLAGVALGLAAAVAAIGLLGHLLFGVSTRDPLTLLLGPALMLAVALLASSLPARRASRLDPAEALRKD